MNAHNIDLIKHALQATKKVRQVAQSREDWELMGYVGAALITTKGNIFTGVNIHLLCGMGICAEYSAVSEMVKSGETEIEKIVATTTEGSILPPCGRCREMLYQINRGNLKTNIVVSQDKTKHLRDLLPLNWQLSFDKSLC